MFFAAEKIFWLTDDIFCGVGVGVDFAFFVGVISVAAASTMISFDGLGLFFADDFKFSSRE